MTIEEYFGDWMKVLDRAEATKIMGWLRTVNPNTLCPALPNVFRAFRLCTYRDCKVVFIGQDPYPQKGIATGILFGNSKETIEDKLSPSLQVVKESVINYEVPHGLITFDNTLESWARQGILMINSALTCELNKVGSHVNVWRPFVSKLIKNLSTMETGIIYVLFGKQAQTLKPYINEKFNDIIEIEHPAYFARTNQGMPHSVFTEINNKLYGKYGEKIKWYEEE
jgi:uracil-DNA glycosylase